MMADPIADPVADPMADPMVDRSPSYWPAGTHLLADLFGVPAALLRVAGAIEQTILDSATAAGAHVLSSHFHSFDSSDGVTGVVVLAESHISIHTWPEHGFAAVDIFMCGTAQPQTALDVICAAFKPVACDVRSIRRGLASDVIGPASVIA